MGMMSPAGQTLRMALKKNMETTQMLDLLKTGTVFRAANPHEVSAYVRSHIGAHSLDLFSRTAKANLRHKSFGSLGLSQITYGGRVQVRSPGLEQSYHLQVVVDGYCSVRYPDKALDLEPGWATLINPLHEVDLNYSSDCVKMIIKLPTGLINKCCAEQYGRIPEEGIRFCKSGFHMEKDSALFRMLELLYLEADQQESRNSLVSTPMGLLVATKLLEIAPHNVQPCKLEPPDVDFFARIDEYIDAKARQEITTDDLAALCCVSSRTLYDRFKKTKGVAPQAYIKERKLLKIHHQIQNRRESARSVTEIALEYGFSHLGRFSSEYKQLFGESPSETLKAKLGQR